MRQSPGLRSAFRSRLALRTASRFDYKPTLAQMLAATTLTGPRQRPSITMSTPACRKCRAAVCLRGRAGGRPWPPVSAQPWRRCLRA